MTRPARADVERLIVLVNEGVLVGHTAPDGAVRKQEFHQLGKRLMADLAKALGSRAKPTSNLGGIAVGGEIMLAPRTFPGLEVIFPSSHWTGHPEAASCFYYRRIDGSQEAQRIGRNHWCDYARLKDMPAVAEMLNAILTGPAPAVDLPRPVPTSELKQPPRAPARSKTRVTAAARTRAAHAVAKVKRRRAS